MSEDRISIVDGRRTPFCKFLGVFAKSPPQELARAAITGSLEALEMEPDAVDAVVAGCVGASVDAPNVARQSALEAGIPARVPAYTVNQACASGLRAVTDAVGLVGRGEAVRVLSVGTESMSSYPVLAPEGLKDVLFGFQRRKGLAGKVKALAEIRPRDLKPVVALQEGLEDSYVGLGMGETAEAMAKIHDLSREEQDHLAMESHLRASRAWSEGKMAEEVTPVCPPLDFDQVVRTDVGFRSQQTMDALARLKPVFDRKGGTVTAGNASMVTDGAAALLVMAEEAAREQGLEPLARVADWHYVGLEPGFQGLMGPAFAVPPLLERNGLSLEDVDLFEINEAFASVVLATRRVWGQAAWTEEHLGRGPLGELDLEKVNVNGGAVALGHPLGATGVRMLLTLGKEMRRRDARVGVAALCVHGGLGAAVLLRRGD